MSPLAETSPPTDHAARPLTQRLKDDNWALHQIAERSPGPRRLFDPAMTRESLAIYLLEFLPIARTLDGLLAAARKADPRLARFVDDASMQAGAIERDLEVLGIDRARWDASSGQPEPIPGAARLIARLRERGEDALYLLGHHYVRMGASNGNHFLAARIRPRLGLGEAAVPGDPRAGTHFLDPFGDAQRESWQRFKLGIDALAEGIDGHPPLRPDEHDRIFEGTQDAFCFAVCMHHETHLGPGQLIERHRESLDKASFDADHAPHPA